MDTTKKYGNSSFWMDRFERSSDVSSTELGKKNNKLYSLASQKRAISNFVSIVTNQTIPVKFASTGDSYTDGGTVVISSRLDTPQEFDVAVGLALHEGSHIKLSDFNLLQSLANEIYNLDDYRELNEIAVAGGVNTIYTIKDILNWVEDRRIDNYIYKSSPGYRAYYQSLYDKYFNDELIDKALKSNELTSEDFDSYMFRLINLHSKYSRLNALKGLKRIWNLIDLKNISRLQSTKDAFIIAVDIFRIICENVRAELQKNQQSQPGQNNDDVNTDNQSESTENGGGSNDSSKSDEKSENNSSNGSSKKEMDDETFEEMLNSMEMGNGGDDKAESGDDGKATSNSKKVVVDNLPDNIGDMVSNGDNSGDDTDDEVETVSLTDRQKDILGKKIKKQKDFLNGEITKTKLSKNEANVVEVLEKSGAEFVEVAKDYSVDNSNYKKIPTINCIFVKNMSKELMETDEFPLAEKVYRKLGNDYGYELETFSSEAVEAGIRLGTVLGRKMQVRSESRDTIFNRQLNGKLDRRMVASLGYGNTQAFYTKETDMYNKVNLHISVDASSSMGSGDIWKNTMTNVVALAKAVDMISNLELQISFRSTSLGKDPYIVIAYDSRVDKFTKIKQLFPHLRPYGTTPEGLCFEAIQKHMVASSNGLDSFFLNISDGEPYFYSEHISYNGYLAAEHTKKMVDGFRKMGIGILSYFVSDGRYPAQNSMAWKIFFQSYGKSAKSIDVTSVNDVSKTMNRMFMEK